MICAQCAEGQLCPGKFLTAFSISSQTAERTIFKYRRRALYNYTMQQNLTFSIECWAGSDEIDSSRTAPVSFDGIRVVHLRNTMYAYIFSDCVAVKYTIRFNSNHFSR